MDSDRLTAGTAQLIRDCDRADAMPEGPVRSALMSRIGQAAARWPQACRKAGRDCSQVFTDAEALVAPQKY